MAGITPFGAFHTAISLIAVFAGLIALVRHGEILFRDRSGRTYVCFTVGSCVTGLFIYHHGGFGEPHVLAIMTLVVLAAAHLAERRNAFGGAARYVAVIGNSLTLFFHMIPGFTETGTRLPKGDPLFASRESPELLAAVAGAFVVFLAGATIQAVRIRSRRTAPATA